MNFDAPFVSLYFGATLLALYLWLWLSPVQALAVLKRYPRTIWPGRIFIALSLLWFAFNLNQVDLGRFDILKTALWLAVPAGYFLIVTYTPDLLSVRGLCTFCLLAGKPVLVAVRWHGSIAHIAVALLVYIILIKCMFLVVYPHFWIRALNRIEANPKQRQATLYVGTGLSVILLICGFISF